MNMRSLAIASLLLVLSTGPSWASFTGSKPEAPSPSSSMPQPGVSTSPRQQAEELYGLAYEEVGRAKKDLADKKDKNAVKKFKRALERGEEAAKLDPTYHEAWNLVGYCARKLGDYDKAFAAYEKCLNLKFEYAPAREYLGEAWLEKGDPKKAREQLVILDKLNAAVESAELKAAIEVYEVAHPTASAPDSTAAPPDTAGTSGSK